MQLGALRGTSFNFPFKMSEPYSIPSNKNSKAQIQECNSAQWLHHQLCTEQLETSLRSQRAAHD